MKVVLTGFEPFAGLSHNPSQAVLELIPDRIGTLSIDKHVLPVDAEQIRAALEPLWRSAPRVLILTGLALERTAISIERVALNVLDFERPDNQQRVIRDRPVIEGAPLALASRLPNRRILDRWREAGIAAEHSNSAGTYLCNQAFYLSLFSLPSVPVGFIHLAPIEQQPLGTQARAIELAIAAISETIGGEHEEGT